MKNNLNILIIVVIALLVFNNIRAPLLRQPFLFSFSLIDIIGLIVLVWLVNYLPSPLREIIIFLLVLWILAALGVFAFIGAFTNIILIALFIIILLSII